MNTGKIISVRTKESWTDYTADNFAYDFDLQLLCDESTGRSAEAFALALKQSEVATVVGRATLGLGTIQKEIEMKDQGLLNLSYARIVGSRETELNGLGVIPDVEVENNTGEDESVDKILNTAVERAQKATTKKVA